MREQRRVGTALDDPGEVNDRVDALENRGQVARGDVDPVELEMAHPPCRFPHVETHHALQPLHRVEVGKQALRQRPATPVTAIVSGSTSID